MKKHFLKFMLVATGALVLTVSGCKKDDHDHDHDNEQELITTVNVVFTPAGGGTPVTFSFVDLDGDGGNAPVITNGTLAANTSYTVATTFLNESETPAEDITEEVRAEGKEHQVFYQVQSGLNLTVTYNDADADNRPIGLINNAAAGAASTGSLTVVLRHEPNKAAANVANGNIANAGGETDVEVTFNVTIQ
jgi:hypothetical protein